MPAPSVHHPRRSRYTVGVALLALTPLTGCGQGQAEEAPRLQLADVVRQDLEIRAEATGQLEPLRKVEVKSKASGEVREVLVDTGDRVEPGTLLVRIDPRDVQNEYNQSVADYEVARERFAIAEAQLRRSESLLQAGVITDQEHESRNLEFANSRAALVRAETNRDLAGLRLEDVTIRSPMTGTVLERSVEDGVVIASASGNVSGGTTLLTIANLDVMQVRTLVDETDVGRIQAGMQATVTVDAFPDRTFQGQVEKIEPQATVQQNVVMFPVIVRLDNREGILKPGMSAEVSILLAQRPSTLTLPNNAIVSFQEMAPAASVLGIPQNLIEMDRSVFQELTREMISRRAEGGEGDAPSEEERERIRAEMVERGAAMRGGAGAQGRPGAGGGGFQGGQGGMPGATARGRGAGQGDMGRPGIVFVQGADGQLRPRPVLIGVNDWSNSEILIGLEEGERVALIGGAQLQAQQQQVNAMMRSRMGGGLPFGR